MESCRKQSGAHLGLQFVKAANVFLVALCVVVAWLALCVVAACLFGLLNGWLAALLVSCKLAGKQMSLYIYIYFYYIYRYYAYIYDIPFTKMLSNRTWLESCCWASWMICRFFLFYFIFCFKQKKKN